MPARSWPWCTFSLALVLLPPLAFADEANWSSAWDSRWRDGGATLYLQQDGDIVTGTYPVLEGEIRGEVRGRLLVGTWQDPGGKGEFVFAMAPDGQSYMGRFGTGEWWTGQRLEAAEVGDQIVADASSPQAALRSFIAAGNAARDDRSDRLGPALAVLDFSELPAALADTPSDRLDLAARLFAILDQLTFRVWDLPEPAPDEQEVVAELAQAGTGEGLRLRFRYGVRANGAAGWFVVVPEPAEMERALERLLVVFGGERDHPHAHEDLRSPRDTMRTFLEQYYEWEATGDGRLLLHTLNLTNVSPTTRVDEAALRAQYLKQVIDRAGYVLWQEIPNFPEQLSPYTHFVHPEGRIEIAPFETDDGRIWQFTPDTLDSVRRVYMAMEDMPLEESVTLPTSSAFLMLRNEIRALDRDLLQTFGGVEIWQWLALVALLLVSVPLSWLVAYLLVRVILRWRREPDAVLSIRSRFIRPLQFLLLAGIGFAALRVLGLPEHVDVPVRVTIGVVLAVASGWLAYNVVDKLGSLAREAAAAGRLRYRDEMLRSIAIAIAKVAVVIGAVLVLAEVLAIPYQGVIAGLGIGGLAVALAARSSLENFIGGLTLLADKPVQVGDFCRFGDKIGTIEGLGLRSVKIRSLDRTVYTVPNGEFVNLHLENFARRDHILLKTVLQLRYETTPDQLRWVLAKTRKLLVQHPRVLADPSRARFTGFGAHSLDIEIFAYIETSDWNEYLGIQEDIYLRLIDLVEASGTGFAFPSTVNYLARDKGLDAERGEQAEAAVATWRKQDRLPFPDFDENERFGMFNTLDFPAIGSPHSLRAQARRAKKEAAD